MKNTFKTLEEMKAYCAQEHVQIGFSDNTSIYKKSHLVGGYNINNSIAILPMEGCDALPDGSPGELTKRRYIRFCEGGAGIVWYEAVAVVEEGRATKQQLFIHKGNADNFRKLIEETKEKALKKNGYAPLMIMQLTHSGRYSKPQGVPSPILAAHNPVLDEKYNIAPDHKLISDSELKALEDRFAEAALLAQNVGFDGIDLKASHGYLLSELLSAHTRDGEYGGDYEGRTRFIRNAALKIKQSVRSDMVLATRFGIYDAMNYPYGFGADKETGGPDLTEPAALLNELSSIGVRICAVTAGNPYYNPHIGRPFNDGAYTPPEPPVKGVERMISLAASIKQMIPDMLFIGAGYSWLKEFAVNAGAYTLENGRADFIGFGRQAFANPGVAKDILESGKIERNKTCITCSKCSQLMRNTINAGCVVRDKTIYASLYVQHIKNKA